MRLSMLRKIVSSRRLALVSILLVAASGSAAAQSLPFTGLTGSWAGAGAISLSDGSKERLRCKATYQVSNGERRLLQSLRCAKRQLPLRSQQRRGQPGWDHRRHMERNQSRNQRKHRGQGVRRPHLGRHRRAGLFGQPVALDARQQAVFLDIVRRRHPERHHQHEPKLIGAIASQRSAGARHRARCEARQGASANDSREVNVHEERRILTPSDSVVSSRRTHRFRCVGAKPCDVISVRTPPTFWMI